MNLIKPKKNWNKIRKILEKDCWFKISGGNVKMVWRFLENLVNVSDKTSYFKNTSGFVLLKRLIILVIVEEIDACGFNEYK